MNDSLTYVLALIGAAFGIGLIVLLNIAMGWTRLRLNTEQQAQSFLRRDIMGGLHLFACPAADSASPCPLRPNTN